MYPWLVGGGSCGAAVAPKTIGRGYVVELPRARLLPLLLLCLLLLPLLLVLMWLCLLLPLLLVLLRATGGGESKTARLLLSLLLPCLGGETRRWTTRRLLCRRRHPRISFADVAQAHLRKCHCHPSRRLRRRGERSWQRSRCCHRGLLACIRTSRCG